MGDPAFMVFRSAGALLGVPQEKVLSVNPWRPVRRLPKGAPWLGGLLEEAGEVIPVVKEEVLGPATEDPEVVVLLEEEGRRLGLPGRSPVLRAPRDGDTVQESGELLLAGDGEDAEAVRIIDPRLLYSTLGLLYNETGSNRGS